MTKDPPGGSAVENAFCLLNVGDSITTDHILARRYAPPRPCPALPCPALPVLLPPFLTQKGSSLSSSVRKASAELQGQGYT